MCHKYAVSKREALGMTNSMPHHIPTDEEIQKAKRLIKNITNFVVPT